MTLKSILISLTLLFLTVTAVAQDNISAVIVIDFEGAEIRRDNSDLWLPLPQNAIAFIGAGDTIRTDGEGRVDVLFNDDSHMLMLSNTEFTLNSFAQNNDLLSFEGAVTGNAIIKASSDLPFESFNLMLNDIEITQPAALMSIWSFTDATDVVTVAEGLATIINNGTEIDVPAESGFFAEEDRTESVAFDPEWHAAGLEASLYGCEGVVQTANNVGLLVRTGPGRGFQAMGTLDVSRKVFLMANTETTGWTRIQFLTGFGWIQSLAVQSECTDLPVFSDDSPEEKFVTLVNVTDDEFVLLQPFFQSPAENAFVYKFDFNR